MAVKTGNQVILRTFQSAVDVDQLVTLTMENKKVNALRQITVDLSKYIINKINVIAGATPLTFLKVVATTNTILDMKIVGKNKLVISFSEIVDASFIVTFNGKILGAEILKGKSIDINETKTDVECTVFGDEFERYAQGIKTAEISIEFFELNEYIYNSITGDTPLILEFYTSIADAPWTYRGVILKYSLKSETKSAQSKTITFKGERI